jgi:hypothetical protein
VDRVWARTVAEHGLHHRALDRARELQPVAHADPLVRAKTMSAPGPEPVTGRRPELGERLRAIVPLFGCRHLHLLPPIVRLPRHLDQRSRGRCAALHRPDRHTDEAHLLQRLRAQPIKRLAVLLPARLRAPDDRAGVGRRCLRQELAQIIVVSLLDQVSQRSAEHHESAGPANCRRS